MLTEYALNYIDIKIVFCQNCIYDEQVAVFIINENPVGNYKIFKLYL